MYKVLRSTLTILLFFIFIGCSGNYSLPDEYEIYNWRLITTSIEIEGEMDTTIVSDTLINGTPINLDSLDLRAELYLRPDELKRVVEYVDTTYIDSIGNLRTYSNYYSTLWYEDKLGFVLSFYPHFRNGYPWSYQLLEIKRFKKDQHQTVNYEFLIDSIQSYRYQRLLEMEKLYGK